MSPFEVAAGCDIIKISQEYPDLLIRGGIDKRILAQGKNDIDKMVDSIIPTLKKEEVIYQRATMEFLRK